jgi:hypothetical protein
MKKLGQRLLALVLLAVAAQAFLVLTERRSDAAFGFTFPFKRRDQLRDRTMKKVHDYFESLPSSEKTIISEAMELCRGGPINPQRLLLGNSEKNTFKGPVFVIVPGLGYEVEELAQPLEQLRNSGATVYFHKWNKLRFTSELVHQLRLNLNWIAREHHHQEVIVLGYSAGGLISLLAWDQYAEKLPPNLHLVTIASPFMGWGIAQGIASVFVAPAMGEFTADISVGVHRQFKHASFRQCEQWVTTSCELDVNACINSSGVYPEYVQRGMPCGDENVKFLNHELHQDALEIVLARLIAEHPLP